MEGSRFLISGSFGFGLGATVFVLEEDACGAPKKDISVEVLPTGPFVADCLEALVAEVGVGMALAEEDIEGPETGTSGFFSTLPPFSTFRFFAAANHNDQRTIATA